MNQFCRVLCLALTTASLVGASGAVAAEDKPPAYGMNLEAFDYPYPVERFNFVSQGQKVSMAYFDVKPQTPNGKTAVLLHGKNFCAATWESTTKALVGQGYRVIAVDQIRFCKSTKPDAYQFTFQQLARNKRDLLASLNVTKPILIGHSTGGMLAIRYALMYPTEVERLVLVDPIGLEDWKAVGVPSLSVDEWAEREARTTVATMMEYEKASRDLETGIRALGTHVCRDVQRCGLAPYGARHSPN